MENALRACCKGIKIGKILIHREGDYGKQVISSHACCSIALFSDAGLNVAWCAFTRQAFMLCIVWTKFCF